MPPGDRRIVSASTDRTSARVGPSSTGWRFPLRARPSWLGPAVRIRDVSARRITLFAFAAATPITTALRLGVLTRDRPVLPKQSAEPGTAGGPFKATPARSFPPGTGRACDADAPGLLRSSASPEVFVPFSAYRPRARCPEEPSSGRSRFGVWPIASRAQAGTTRSAYAPEVFRRAESLRWCSNHGGRVREELSSRILRSVAKARRPVAHVPFVFDRRAGEAGETASSRSRAIRPRRAPPLRFCRPGRVIRRRVPWRGVPNPFLTRALAA